MQIDRTGTVNFHDASLAVWEEGISAARDAGGWVGAQAWERQFKRDVFARIVQQLGRLGYSVGPCTHIFTGNNARYCRKGDLRADLRISGRHIELNFFQNVNAPDRPDHGGRYQSDKERHMPYLLRLEMERSRRKIRDYLCGVLSGYTFEPERSRKIGPGNGCVTAMEAALERRKRSGHYVEELGRARYSNGAEQSADGPMLSIGGKSYSYDSLTRVAQAPAQPAA